jgi:uncharacterized protein (TIGR00369 family)
MRDFERRARASFAEQAVMETIGATLTTVEKGHVEIELPFDAKLGQQHGFVHGGIIATALDSACGYAALTTMPDDAGILTIEFKVNLLAPAKGELFRFEGRVVKSGRTITVAEGAAMAIGNGQEKKIATMTATLMAIHGRDDVRG